MACRYPAFASANKVAGPGAASAHVQLSYLASHTLLPIAGREIWPERAHLRCIGVIPAHVGRRRHARGGWREPGGRRRHPRGVEAARVRGRHARGHGRVLSRKVRSHGARGRRGPRRTDAARAGRARGRGHARREASGLPRQRGRGHGRAVGPGEARGPGGRSAAAAQRRAWVQQGVGEVTERKGEREAGACDRRGDATAPNATRHANHNTMS